MRRDPVLWRWIDGLLAAGAWIGSLATWTIGGIVFWDVTMRYLGQPTIWALEVSSYLMIATAVLASGRAVVEGDHFAVTLLPEALPPRARRWLGLAVGLASTALLVFIAIGFANLLALSLRFDMTSPTQLHVPLWIPQSVLVAGFVLMALGFLRRTLGGPGAAA